MKDEQQNKQIKTNKEEKLNKKQNRQITRFFYHVTFPLSTYGAW